MASPNIILFMTDQQRYDSIRALGQAHMVTPNLDLLAGEGVSFTNCFCTAPSCVPSRASFFNGCYPHTTGVFNNGTRWTHSWVEMLQAARSSCRSGFPDHILLMIRRSVSSIYMKIQSCRCRPAQIKRRRNNLFLNPLIGKK